MTDHITRTCDNCGVEIPTKSPTGYAGVPEYSHGTLGVRVEIESRGESHVGGLNPHKLDWCKECFELFLNLWGKNARRPNR